MSSRKWWSFCILCFHSPNTRSLLIPIGNIVFFKVIHTEIKVIALTTQTHKCHNLGTRRWCTAVRGSVVSQQCPKTRYPLLCLMMMMMMMMIMMVMMMIFILFSITRKGPSVVGFFIRVLFYQSDTEWSLIKAILASAGHRTTALQVTRIGDCRHRWPLWLATIVM